MKAFNENVIKGKWLEIKGDLQKTWGKLSDDDLEKTKGDMKAIGGLIQQRYGEAQENTNKKLENIVKRFEAQKDEAVSGIKKAIKK
ncbi:MAG: CsbD family protein [Bdellovibrionales bacterium]|nr:CsbD family protein [Bdellovibrionales bacterium]